MKRSIIWLALLATTSIFAQQKADPSDRTLVRDYSYAGYARGEKGVPEVKTLGLKTFDITRYGAVADDGKSDRKAFEAAIAAATEAGGGIIWVPRGTFDLHNESDPDQTIFIESGNIVLKGADRTGSILRMTAKNHPTDSTKMWTSPSLICFRSKAGVKDLTQITADAPQDSFTIEVASTKGLKAGDWICISLRNNSEEVLRNVLGAHRDYFTDPTADLLTNGVSVTVYHQIRNIDGKRLTLREPIFYGIDHTLGWKVGRYGHLEGVGVEDLTFEGNAKPDFKHHGSWEDDGAYKMVDFLRVTDSWMRRLTFRHVSEASSIVSSANVSVYDIRIEGRRGHSALRSQGSSRVFMGKVFDFSDSQQTAGAGQWHSVGVSKHSMGAVIWRCEWGTEGCFESHATQPRYTLFDACRGAFLRLHQGGAENQLPNHMEGLTLWNFDATNTSNPEGFSWWNRDDIWTKFLPPVIVGYHGADTPFTDVKADLSHGKKVSPESLYEAQLTQRLGKLPAWLKNLKKVSK